MDIGSRKLKSIHIIDVVGKINRLKDSIVLKSFINGLLEKMALADKASAGSRVRRPRVGAVVELVEV